jgi:hypothetical protein
MVTTTALSPAVDGKTRVSRRGRVVLIAEGLLAWVAIRWWALGGPGAFPDAGSLFAGRGTPKGLAISPGAGYDGQFVYRFALAPFNTNVTAHGITLDVGGYRQQRILTPLLSYVVSLFPGISTALAILVVNTIAVGVAIYVGACIAEDLGRAPQLGILLAIPAGMPASLGLDLNEPVAWAGVLCAVFLARRQRWALAALSFTAALLARETSAIVLFGFAVEALVVARRHGWRVARPRAWLALPIVIEAGWQIWLWSAWGRLPALIGLRSTGAGGPTSAGPVHVVPGSHGSGLPLVGIAEKFFTGFTGPAGPQPILGVSYICERVVLVALLVVAGWSLAHKVAQPGLAVCTSWIAATVMAVCLSGWVTDVQFLRAAMEAWGLSVLVLLQTLTRASRFVLIGAAVTTTWMVVATLPRR